MSRSAACAPLGHRFRSADRTFLLALDALRKSLETRTPPP